MEIDPFILIGGRSSRFGHDKSSALLGGKTLIHRLSETVKQALPGRSVTLVARSDEQEHAGSDQGGLAMIFDRYPGRGPLGGLQAALAYSRSPWAFVLACDLPFISTDLIGHLVRNIGEGHDVVLPVQPDGRLQPLCVLYRRDTCLPAFESILAEDHLIPPLHRIIEGFKARLIRFDDIRHLPDSDRFFLNINTTHDLEIASKLLARDVGTEK